MLNQHSRRRFLSDMAACSLAGVAGNSWLGGLAARAADQRPAKSCIVLWMTGGPSHLDTFDLKPEAPSNVRGEFKPIDTSVSGIQVSEYFPQFAKRMKHAAILRGMRTVESDHQLATYHVHTGYQQRAGGINFPSLGSIASHELGNKEFPLPNFVCVGRGARHAVRSGFLGPDHQPLEVSDPERGTDNLEPLTSRAEFARRYETLRHLDGSFRQAYRADSAEAHASALDRAVRLMSADQKSAFDLSRESDSDRDRYGRTGFGQGCLMARRLVETGVPFVEVTMQEASWDTHRDNFSRTRSLSEDVDAGMSALIDDLDARGRLDSTLVIWMGEFGRSPQITSGAGRNHWAKAWSTVLAGGGIRGGQVIGQTDRTAAEVVERPISVTDFLATICKVLQIDHTRQNVAAGVNRPVPIVDNTKPVKIISELF
jgi:hypothetical protein